MSLKNIQIKKEYRTLKERIEEEFYLPVLKEAVMYKRGVGFFSSNALVDISRGLDDLKRNDGHIELVASPKLTYDDYQAILIGYSTREEIIHNAVLREMKEPMGLFEKRSLNLLANLIADGTLDIKLAIPQGVSNNGIYHEKVGIIADHDGNRIAFSGSMNETDNAFENNYESIDVFTSWENNSDLERVNNKEKAFDLIWNKEEETIETNEANQLKDAFIQKYKMEDIDYINYIPSKRNNQIVPKAKELANKHFPKIPDDITLDPSYQTIAIESWVKNHYRGIFDMATGTGKTYTGLGAICRISKELKYHLAVIIIVPYQHLVDQWVEDIMRFNMKPIIGYSTSPQKDWKRRLDTAVRDQTLGNRKPFFCFVSTYASFKSSYVQKMIGKIKSDKLLVADEAHNLGAKQYQSILNDSYEYRLALSATLDRYMDEEGTAFLHDFFGPVCLTYTLEKAIQEKKLTKYKYYPVIVELSDNELDKYAAITKEMSKHIITDTHGNMILDHYGEILALKRARIVAGAVNKLDALRKTIRPYKDQNNILVYCGATNVNLGEEDLQQEGEAEDNKQIIEVSKILGNEFEMKNSRFTAEESAEQRQQIKEHFSNGKDLQAIVAIKCLDEGVNIPGIKTAFILASSTNPKEYIQRRGRVLRKAKNKEYAEIYDFVTLPRDLSTVAALPEEDTKMDHSLVKNELRRMKEFSKLSMNPMSSQAIIWEIEEAYHLEDSSIEEREN